MRHRYRGDPERFPGAQRERILAAFHHVPQHPHHPGTNTQQCSGAEELRGAGTGARCLAGTLFSLAPASPGGQLSPNDLPDSEGVGSGAGRELFISVPHQRAAAGDATAAPTAQNE